MSLKPQVVLFLFEVSNPQKSACSCFCDCSLQPKRTDSSCSVVSILSCNVTATATNYLHKNVMAVFESAESSVIIPFSKKGNNVRPPLWGTITVYLMNLTLHSLLILLCSSTMDFYLLIFYGYSTKKSSLCSLIVERHQTSPWEISRWHYVQTGRTQIRNQVTKRAQKNKQNHK